MLWIIPNKIDLGITLAIVAILGVLVTLSCCLDIEAVPVQSDPIGHHMNCYHQGALICTLTDIHFVGTCAEAIDFTEPVHFTAKPNIDCFLNPPTDVQQKEQANE